MGELPGGEQAANTLQPDGSGRDATTANAKVRGAIEALRLVTRWRCLRSHSRSHRFDPCHAHQHKRVPAFPSRLQLMKRSTPQRSSPGHSEPPPRPAQLITWHCPTSRPPCAERPYRYAPPTNLGDRVRMLKPAYGRRRQLLSLSLTSEIAVKCSREGLVLFAGRVPLAVREPNVDAVGDGLVGVLCAS